MRLIRMATAIAVFAAAATAQAQLLDALKGKSEFSSQLYVYDVRANVDTARMKEIVYNALTDQTINATVRDGELTSSVPQYPGRIQFKELSVMTLVLQVPSCPGASFTVGSSDNSMARWGDSTQYIACGFRYAGGWRVDIYIASQSSGGGIGGLLSGKTIGKAIAGAMGFSSDPRQFIESSVDKLEKQFKDGAIDYALVEAAPGNPNRVVAEDSLLKARKNSERRVADRAKRLAARADLQKLGIDASDEARLIRAIQSGDEDVVSLFVEAGAIDLSQPDATGRKPADYATKQSIKDLLGTI